MITQLTGTLVKADLTTAVLDVNGVGYLISIPMSTFDALPRAGEKTTLLTHMQISENDIALYGFATERERTVFGMLITVSGIGPKTALNILSSLNIPAFCQALASSDIKSLKRINGIGPKSAERMIVELRDKVGNIVPEAPFLGKNGESVKSKEIEDAILALGQMLGEENGNDFNSDTPDFSLVSAALRADKPAESLSQKETLSLAPSACDGHVTVARVLAAEGSGEDRA